MTTKELIRQKIAAYYAEYKAKFHQNGDSYHLGIIDGLDMAVQILDTLPDEPVSDCHDLEEAAEEYIQKIKAVFLRTLEHPTAKDCFIHGAKWAFRQGWTFDAHKGAFGICFDRNIDDLLDSLKDEEEVTVQIRKK